MGNMFESTASASPVSRRTTIQEWNESIWADAYIQQTGLLCIFMVLLFVVLMTRPNLSLPGWSGVSDGRFLYATITGVSFLLICAVILCFFGASIMAWWILIFFALVPLIPLSQALFTNDASHSLTALLQRVTRLNEWEHFLYSIFLVVIPLSIFFAGGKMGAYFASESSSLEDVNSYVLVGMVFGGTIMAVTCQWMLSEFSSQSIIFWANSGSPMQTVVPSSSSSATPYIPINNQTLARGGGGGGGVVDTVGVGGAGVGGGSVVGGGGGASGYTSVRSPSFNSSSPHAVASVPYRQRVPSSMSRRR